MFRSVVLVIFLFSIKESSSCIGRDFGESSFVCVCNETACDFDGPSTPIEDGKIRLITSSRDQYRNFVEIVDRQTSDTINISDATNIIFIHSDISYQSIIGYGGAFTDAAAIGIKSLPDAAQEMLLRSYFSEEGNRYNLVRVPIAGSDFSTHPYSYDDVEGDVDLEFFALPEEDTLYKLPVMKRAVELCPEELYIFGSPWSPPSWMKTNGMFNGSGELKKEMWQPYSNYLVKFIQSYETELQTQLWGLTPQNEPLGGFDPNWSFNTCGYTAEDMRDFIKQNLGPTLEAAGFRRLKLMIDDYNRFTLPWYPIPMLIDSNCSSYIDGVAVHWYDDFTIGPQCMDDTHDLAPEKFILLTEGCEGTGSGVQHVALGDWGRGERYIIDIIENSNHWSSGWVDWNLVLDMEGGPNWVDNLGDAPIIANAELGEFYLQPMFYAMNMFSRNVQRGAKRIYHAVKDDDDNTLPTTAFLNPDGKIVIITANTSENDKVVAFTDQSGEYFLKTTIAKKSWVSISF